MGFDLEVSVPVLTVFFQGILSFFSPCVLPLVPLYVGYLAGGARRVEADGTVRYPRRIVLVNTLFFVLGVSFAFFLLGLGFTALGRFFSGSRTLFARVSGIIMLLFGVYQLGFFGRESFLETERRLPFRLDRWAMSPLVALVLGFTFSFAWTPCVGPTLGGVLLMASSSASAGTGFLLIGVYTLGFVLPFLAVGLFTGTVLDFFKRHQNVVKVTVKAGAVLLILMGIMTLTGWMNGVTGYLSSLGNAVRTETPAPSAESSSTPAGPEASPEPSAGAAPETESFSAPDFTLADQYGEEHSLSDYQGKVVFLNFWATWCGPCQSEMPHIQDLYENYGENGGEDLVVLTVANPRTDENPYNQDVTQAGVEDFLAEGGYTFPVLMDTTGEVFYQYGIQAFPTTFMIDREGNFFGYVMSALSYDMMESIVNQTLTGKRTG